MHDTKMQQDQEVAIKHKAQSSKAELVAAPTISEESELPRLVFENSDTESFLTDSWTSTPDNLTERDGTPNFMNGPSIAYLVNPPQVDIEMCSDIVPPMTADFIDRKMSQMTEMRGQLEVLEITC